MPRPALLPVHHPLAFSSPTDGHQNNLKTPAEHSSLANPQSAGDKVHFLFERQRLVSLLDEYAYVLDACMVHHAAAQTWAGLFTDDCIVTFPFGTHHGTKGLAGWCLGAETRFSRMLHMSSNMTITFESDIIAHGRSALFAICGVHSDDINKNFSEGGYYYWSFRKVGETWKISYLFLDVMWENGDSLGLNEPGAATTRAEAGLGSHL
ncbi:hypothetical protein LTS17_009753 [Exophiala oligosperma]